MKCLHGLKPHDIITKETVMCRGYTALPTAVVSMPDNAWMNVDHYPWSFEIVANRDDAALKLIFPLGYVKAPAELFMFQVDSYTFRFEYTPHQKPVFNQYHCDLVSPQNGITNTIKRKYRQRLYVDKTKLLSFI